MYRKIAGVGLVIIGLAIIFWTVFESYSIFNGKKEPPKVFQISEEVLVKTEKLEPGTIEEKMQILQQQMLQEYIEKELPSGTLVKLFNLISWSIGALIFFMGGGKIAQIGGELFKSGKIEVINEETYLPTH